MTVKPKKPKPPPSPSGKKAKPPAKPPVPTPAAIDVPLSKPQVVSKTTNLPLFLAGPIVKRTEPGKVWFWFASSQEITQVETYLYVRQNYAAPIAIAKPELKTRRFGEHLWIVLVGVAPASGSFPLDTVIEYALVATSSNKNLEPPLPGEPVDDPGVASITKHVDALNYPPYVFPTFTIAGENRRLVHGSCRRQGAPGPDAFLALDIWVAGGNAQDATARPHALLLTGDQIYADDLAEPLYKGVIKLARDVFEYSEYVPTHDGTDSMRVEDGYPADYSDKPAANSRKKVASLRNQETGFTTDDGQGHMLSFAEYSALYLIGSNKELFEKYVPGYADYPRQDEFPMTSYPDAARSARRVMANFPTYNILDDHDVTDDWNLDAPWVAATNNPFGRRVISNALASAFIFQTWGNDPDRYDDAFLDAITKHTDTLTESGGLTPDPDDFETTMLGRTWEFVTPTHPPVLCVDTRTQREYPADTKLGCILSGPKTWPGLKKQIAKYKLGTDQTLLIVLATPLLLHRSAVWGQNHSYGKWKQPLPPLTDTDLFAINILRVTQTKMPLTLDEANALVDKANAKRADDKYSGDYELYPDNVEQRPKLIRFFYDELKLSSLVIFSGDVHHGFVIDAVYGQGASANEVYKGNTDWSMRVTQITSSPVKNMEKDKFVDDAADGFVPTDVGNIGESIKTLWEIQHAQTDDNRTIAMQATALNLAGPLGRETYVYENHFCMVDMPKSKGGELTCTFLGAKYQDVPPIVEMGVINYPGKPAEATVTIDTSNAPDTVKLANWADKHNIEYLKMFAKNI